MSVRQIVTTIALISPTGSTVATLTPFECTWTQDEGASPMFVATVVVAAPTDAQYAMMRPGSGYYLSVAADYSNVGSGPQIWKIVSRERTVEGRVRLQAVSPEMDLQSYRPSAVDRSNWANQNDVRLILANVLTKVYGAGKWARYTYTADGAFGQDIGVPTFPTFQDLTNLHPNPSATTLDGFFANSSAGSTTASVSLSQTVGNGYSNGVRAQAAVAVTYMDVRYLQNAENPIKITGGKQYSASVAVRASNTRAISGTLYIQFADDTGAVVLTTSKQLGVLSNNYGSNARATVTARAPYNASRVGVVLRGTGSMQRGDVLDGTQWLVAEGDGTETDGVTQLAWWDGETVDGTNGYNYDWSGTANASTATRTPVVDRDPETLTWSPSQSAWDFLAPILQTVGVHMWADGYSTTYPTGSVTPRYFWALNEFGLAAAPLRIMQTYNLYDLEQVDSWTAEFPDGTPMYADQVIIRYTWTDAGGADHDVYDVYPSTGKKPYYIELENTPFAGAGRARGIYNRISARATMLNATTWFNRALFPGKQAIVTADAVGGSVVGYVDSVTHDPFRGTSEVRTKQTIAYTSSSWAAATGSWASQTGSWAADT